MSIQAMNPHDAATQKERHVYLPLTALGLGACLRVHGGKGMDGQVTNLTVKAIGLPSGAAPWQEALAAAQQGAQQVRLAEPLSHQGARWIRLEMALERHAAGPATEEPEPIAPHLAAKVGLPGLREWAAAAGTLADRMARQLFPDNVGHVLLLAGMNPDEARPELWGRLQPLPEALQAQVLQALHQHNPMPEAWARAMVLISRVETASSKAFREALQALLPTSTKVCTADSLIGLNGPEGTQRSPRCAEVWFPIAGAGGASLHRMQVSVSPWRRERGSEPPVEVILDNRATSPNQRNHLFAEIASVVRSVRDEELPSLRQWQTLVTVPENLVQAIGPSYQLALAVADRMARGREWPGQGRTFATGGINLEMGKRALVENVSGNLTATFDDEAANDKLNAFLSTATPGDTVLVPAAWRVQVEQCLAERGKASPQLVFVERAVP